MEIQWHLSEPDFFTGLPVEKEAFLAAATRQTHQKGEFVFVEDEPGDSAFYLDDGAVQIFRASAMGKEPVFSIRQAGELFGLAEVMGGRERKCSAQAISPVVVHRVEKAAFERLLSGHYPLARRVIEVLGRRLRYLGEQIENLMVCDVATRLLKLFVYLAYQRMVGQGDLETPIVLPVKLTQEQLAAMTGSCQQTVSEVMRQLQSDGLILVSRKEITLLNPRQAMNRIYL